MRILVLGAGGPAGVNLLRALHSAGHDLTAYDDNPAHLIWCKPFATITEDPRFGAGEIDLLIPQPDALLERLSEWPWTFLPPKTTIQRCQDKPFAVRQWDHMGLRSGSVTIEKPWPDHLRLAQDKFGLPFWLRATKGAGAKGAIKVASCDQAYHWIRFWETRGAEIEWMAEEFFPGRDLAWSSIWHRGELVTSFLRERIEYLYPHLTPEGLTGTPTIARVLHDLPANATAVEAVKAIDETPHGIFSVDLREDSAGVPRPTEINAGRGFTTFGLWSMYDWNFADIAARLGAGLELEREPPTFNALPEGLTLSRHIDCEFQFTFAKEEALAA